MADRYLITGVQLGVLKGLLKANKIQEADELLDEVIDKQYVGYSSNSVEEDSAELYQEKFPKPKGKIF